jgi:hypothetical protein
MLGARDTIRLTGPAPGEVAEGPEVASSAGSTPSATAVSRVTPDADAAVCAGAAAGPLWADVRPGALPPQAAITIAASTKIRNEKAPTGGRGCARSNTVLPSGG